MVYKEGYFTTTQDDNLYYQYWLPEGKPKAILLVLHGLAEHSGRYMNIVRRFVPQGYAVYSFDHLGHGKSDGKRVYVDRFDDFLQPLQHYLEMVRGWQPGVPVFLVGHSLGGLIAAIYLLDYQQDVQGAILSGAAVKIPDNISNATIFTGKLLAALAPKVGLIGVNAQAISRDPVVVKAYVSDPLVTTKKTSARLASEMLKAMQRVEAEATKISQPVLIMHGSADRLINPQASFMLHDRVSSSKKTLRIWEGFYHEIYNEPEQEEVFCEVEVWLATRLGEYQLINLPTNEDGPLKWQ